MICDNPEELICRIHHNNDAEIVTKDLLFQSGRICTPTRDDLADILASMANTRASMIILGVDETTRDIPGIPRDRLDTVQDYVVEICNDAINPPLLIRTFKFSQRHPVFRSN